MWRQYDHLFKLPVLPGKQKMERKMLPSLQPTNVTIYNPKNVHVVYSVYYVCRKSTAGPNGSVLWRRAQVGDRCRCASGTPSLQMDSERQVSLRRRENQHGSQETTWNEADLFKMYNGRVIFLQKWLFSFPNN